MVWTKSPIEKPGDPCNVDLIELPRLQLTFFSKLDPDGSVRLYPYFHLCYGRFLIRTGSAVITSVCSSATNASVCSVYFKEFRTPLFWRVSPH